MVNWKDVELTVLRLEYHYIPKHPLSADFWTALTQILRDSFGEQYRTYDRQMVAQQVYQLRETKVLPQPGTRPVSCYKHDELFSIATNRLSNLEQNLEHWVSFYHTVEVAFPGFHEYGTLEERDGLLCSNPPMVHGFDVSNSAFFIEQFACEVFSDLWPQPIHDRCWLLFIEQEQTPSGRSQRYSNEAISDLLRQELRNMEAPPNLITAESVEWCIWGIIRQLPLDGTGQRMIAYDCGRPEV